MLNISLAVNGKDKSGNPVSSGIYFFALRGEGFQIVRKGMLVD